MTLRVTKIWTPPLRFGGIHGKVVSLLGTQLAIQAVQTREQLLHLFGHPYESQHTKYNHEVA